MVPECWSSDIAIAVIHFCPIDVIVEDKIRETEDEDVGQIFANGSIHEDKPDAQCYKGSQTLFKTVFDASDVQEYAFIFHFFWCLVDEVDVPMFDLEQHEESEDGMHVNVSYWKFQWFEVYSMIAIFFQQIRKIFSSIK